MVLRVTQLFAVLVAALTFSTQTALAQDGDPGQVTRHAVEAMQRVTHGALDNIHTATTRGIENIRRLDHDGATDRELIEAAHRAARTVNRAASHGKRRVNFISARAFNILREITDERRFFHAVAEARGQSQETITHGQRRARHAIQAALEKALED